jgi:hypothetical protein
LEIIDTRSSHFHIVLTLLARDNSVAVSLFVKESGVLRKYLPEYFSQFLTNKLRQGIFFSSFQSYMEKINKNNREK